MPEGDTVYLTARRLSAALGGRRLRRGELRHPRLSTHDLAGRTVLEARSVGKHLLIRLDDGRTLHSHLRMDGSWHLYPPGERWRKAAHHARAVLVLDQRAVAGIGNIYRCETCFLIGASPRLPVGRLADPARAIRTARRLLLRNADRPEQSTTGELGQLPLSPAPGRW